MLFGSSLNFVILFWIIENVFVASLNSYHKPAVTISKKTKQSNSRVRESFLNVSTRIHEVQLSRPKNFKPNTLKYYSNFAVNYEVKCNEERIIVTIEKPEYESQLYLDNLKYLPEIGCQPSYDGKKVIFNLPLVNFSICGITRVTHQLTGTRTFLHRIIVENINDLDNKEILNFKCTIPGPNVHNITKREVLPAGFKEQDDIESIMTVETNAPEPILNVTVKQGYSAVDGELNVKPGTPLTMEIYLDEKSIPVYGLLVSFMRVTDTKSQEETIILNGCSVDPYLFENFNTINGDVLSAKFRAFKFPESTYVQFTGVVNICLDKCQGIKCSHGQIGYGRKKRKVAEIPHDPKKVFEVTLTTFLKVDSRDVTHLKDV